MSTQQHLAKVGAAAAISGVMALFVATLLHPMKADPNDPMAAFTEYAGDSLWVASHLGQFLGFAILGVALVALAATMEAGAPSAWARIGVIGTAASIATAAVLQAVDGVALGTMVKRWMQASGEARERAFEAAFAVRQVEIGLASFLGVLFGLTVSVFAIAMLLGRRFPTWLGCLGLLAGLATLAAGIAGAYTGFSAVEMMISMPASAVMGLWALALGAFLWRLAPEVSEKDRAV